MNKVTDISKVWIWLKSYSIGNFGIPWFKKKKSTTSLNMTNPTTIWEKVPTYIDYHKGETNMAEETLAGFEKSLEELQNAIRRMAKEHNETLTTLSKISESLAVLRAEVNVLKQESELRTKREMNLGRTNY